MPVNAASKSIKLADDVAEKHDVQFVVHSHLAGADVEQLNHHLGDHLQYMRALMNRGILPISGPFFTTDGKNTGNGFYVLRVDNLEEASRIAAEDPLDQSGVRIPRLEPWLQVMG